MKLLLRG